MACYYGQFWILFVLRLDPVAFLWSELIVFLIVSSSKLIDLSASHQHEEGSQSMKKNKNHTGSR
jgi:hypothetical protein